MGAIYLNLNWASLLAQDLSREPTFGVNIDPVDCPRPEVFFNGASDMFLVMVASAAAPTTTIDALVRNSRLLRA